MAAPQQPEASNNAETSGTATPEIPFTFIDVETSQLSSYIDSPRGRLKRRRILTHSPARASSPSRGHDRSSGSRHRHHHRKHHRASSSRSIQHSVSPAAYGTAEGVARKKDTRRRRSDAEIDHTLRGRARMREGSRSRSPILEGECDEGGGGSVFRRRRSQPPSRGWVGKGGEGGGGDGAEMRRQRSFPNLYRTGRGRRDSGAEEEGEREDGMQGVKSGALAVLEV